jgi:RHS repeat-associated protein
MLLNEAAFTTIATVASKPASGQWSTIAVTDTNPYRYLRYVGPDNSYCNVADIKFIAVDGTTVLSGSTFGTSPAYLSGREYTKAFDGDPTSFFDYKYASGGFTGIDLGQGNAKQVGSVSFYPRAGYEYRMISGNWLNNGQFQGSNTAPQMISVISQVQSSDGRAVNYVYTSQNDPVLSQSHVLLTNVNYDDGTQAAYTYTQVFPGTRPVISTCNEPRNRALYPKIKNTYYTGELEALGQVQSQANLITGGTLVTLTTNGAGNYHLPEAVYPGGRTMTYNMQDGSSTQGLMSQKIDGLGNRTSYSRANSSLGFILSGTDPLGNVASRTPSKYNNDLAVVYPDGSGVSYSRDGAEQVTGFVDPDGNSSTYSRDGMERVTQTLHPDGSTEAWTYNSNNQALTHTTPNGGVAAVTYDSSGRQTSFTDPAGNATLYGYDAMDRPISATDAMGHNTQMAYNAQGQITQLTFADGSVTANTYDAFGNLTTVTNALGNSWTYVYDDIRRLLSATDPLGNKTAYTYPDAATRKPSLITYPTGKKAAFSFDANGKLLSQTLGYGSADAATTTYTYDSVGNMTSYTDPNGKKWIYTYNSRNWVASASDPLGNTTSFAYDANGNKLTITRPDGGVTSNIYDKMNRLVQSTDPKGQVTKMGYDNAGNLISLVDPKNSTYSYTYDALNRKTSMVYPDGSKEQWSYDNVGNLISYTTRAGQVCSYSYDVRNRNTGYTWSDGTPGSTKTYDSAGRLLTNGNGVSTLNYTYDAANRMTSETQMVVGQPGRTVSYAYDADGNRASLTYPTGSVISYSYNGRNLVASVSADGPPPVATYTYDGNGNRLSKTLENGVATGYVYDAANRLTSVTHSLGSNVVAGYGYTLNAVGNRTSRVETTASGANTDNYSYDAVDQVTGVGYGSGRTVSYAYDPAGNRTSVIDSGATTAYAANALNQYVSAGPLALSYDANGNLASTSVWNYTYDAQNRLVSATNGQTTAAFAYDARNRCVSRTINGVATYFAYDGWDLIGEYDGSGTEQARYVHGPAADEMLCRISPSGTVYYHQDGNNNVVALTDATGNVVERYAYDVFGAAMITDSSGNPLSTSAIGNRFMFTGREYIAEIGLYDYRNRVYSQSLGRFLQTDPIRFNAGDWNIYRYVGNGVVNRRDSLGLFLEQLATVLDAEEPAVARMAAAASAAGASNSQASNFAANTANSLTGAINATNDFVGQQNGMPLSVPETNAGFAGALFNALNEGFEAVFHDAMWSPYTGWNPGNTNTNNPLGPGHAYPIPHHNPPPTDPSSPYNDGFDPNFDPTNPFDPKPLTLQNSRCPDQ